MSPGAGEHHQVLVLGGGVAGVSCALECVDVRLDTVLLEAEAQLGGQVTGIPHHVRNVAAGVYDDAYSLPTAVERSAAILSDRARRSSPVTAADLAARGVQVGGARLTADALVIATGVGRRRLPAAPDGAFDGDVTYLLESDPERFIGRHVVVIGGGDSASLDALELARGGSTVDLVHRSDRLTSRPDVAAQVAREPRITQLGGWELAGLGGGERLERVELVRTSTGERRPVAAGGLVVKVGSAPQTGLFGDQLDLDRSGAVVVDTELRTSRPGVFAAGDVVAGAYWRIATAMGQGSLAARSVQRFLAGAAT
jgi:thioredoxin reductase (NADPH)